MISLIFSATPSLTDLEIIPEAFQNDSNNSSYQILLIVLSGLITWYLISTYNLQLSHQIFAYLIIAGFYFLLKYGFKITGYIISSINIERNKPSYSPKRRSKNFSRPKYNPFKKLKKKNVIVKKSYLKKLWKLNEKDSSTTENVVRQTEKHMEQLDKKSEFKEEKYEDLINEDNDIIQEEIYSFVNNEMSNNKKSFKRNEYTYEKIKDLVRIVGLKKTGVGGILKEPRSNNEFEELKILYKTKYNISPSFIRVKISCGLPDHKNWITKPTYLQSGR